MAVQSILRMGHPCLLQKAAPVIDFNTSQLHNLIRDMEDTMVAYHGAGIAAPQIGVSLQVVIFGSRDLHRNPRYPDAEPIPYTVLINPTITPLNELQEDGWEGCLSVPDLRGVVPRYVHLRYTGYDQYGVLIDRTVSDFHARVVQHECDHLEGVLYPMRIKNLTKFGYTEVIFPNQDIQDD